MIDIFFFFFFAQLTKNLKSRHDAVASFETESAERKESLFLSDSDSSEKENRHEDKNMPSNEALLDSSDEEFNQSKLIK